MHDRLHASLARMFDTQRIVFWYDHDQDMREAFDTFELTGVEKIEIANNEFGLKYRMLRQEPKTHFLLYKDGPEPPPAENWLLDVQLATTVFKADQAAIWLAELGLPPKFEDMVREHLEFFRAKSRLEALKKIADTHDTPIRFRLRMLAVCAGAEGGLDTVIEGLLGELADERDEGLRLIERSGLTQFFWDQVRQLYGYKSDEPDFEDFAITLFQFAYARALQESGKLNTEAALLFSRWKNNRTSLDAFGALSARYQDVLRIEDDVKARDFRDLVTADHFEEIDRHIIRSLVHAMATQTVSAADMLGWVRARRQSHWYGTYEDIYQAIAFATEFHQALAEADLRMTSPEEGVRRYVASWYRLDQLYRKFLFHLQRSGQPSLLAELFDAVENHYANSFMLTVNDAWQDQVNRLEWWDIPGYERQLDFYRKQAATYRRKDQKVVVIISDAFRYEVAEEALREIRKLNRFDAELSAIIGALPSYTQLGMAALLPHQSLSFKGDGALILADGEETSGLAARGKLLAKGRKGDRSKVISFEDMMNMRSDAGKELFRNHDIVYVYHNHIDAIADKAATEDRLPEAAQKAIEDLTTLVRKLTSANFSNILITADHGFLYQHRALDETSYSIADLQGDEIIVRNRRYVIGRGLEPTPGMTKFSAEQLGLSGNMDVLISNSVNRLRRQGAGARFVHGGASLQEIVVPVLRVGKRRKSDLAQVEVQIIISGKSQITSGQIAVTLYQAQAVSEKIQSRALLAGIYALDDTLISDEHQLTFDFTSGNARERELPLKLLLSREADKYNDQEVVLKLREGVGKTSHYRDYATHRLQLRRGITTDFDF